MQKKILADLPQFDPVGGAPQPSALDLKRRTQALKRARRAAGNKIPGESKLARRIRRRAER